jgi:hypothetical protein
MRPLAALRPFAGVGEGNLVRSGAGAGEGTAPCGPMSKNRRRVDPGVRSSVHGQLRPIDEGSVKS